MAETAPVSGESDVGVPDFDQIFTDLADRMKEYDALYQEAGQLRKRRSELLANVENYANTEIDMVPEAVAREGLDIVRIDIRLTQIKECQIEMEGEGYLMGAEAIGQPVKVTSLYPGRHLAHRKGTDDKDLPIWGKLYKEREGTIQAIRYPFDGR